MLPATPVTDKFHFQPMVWNPTKILAFQSKQLRCHRRNKPVYASHDLRKIICFVQRHKRNVPANHLNSPIAAALLCGCHQFRNRTAHRPGYANPWSRFPDPSHEDEIIRWRAQGLAKSQRQQLRFVSHRRIDGER